jgi:hypothetical protein
MSAGPSLLSLAASALYAFVFLGCTGAAIAASRSRQAPGHRWTWLLLAVLFAGFAVLRIFEVEDLVRDAVRQSLRDDGDYSARRSVQGPIAAGMLMLVGVGAMAALYRWGRALHGRRNRARIFASLAALAMLLLIALRMISLHAVDALLYGPVKLNWLVDLGASLVVLGSAMSYAWIVRRAT